MKAFREISIATADGRFAIAYNGVTIPVYSERSGTRDLVQLRDVIETAANGFVPIIVAPYGEALAPLLELRRPFIFLAPVSFSGTQPDDERLVASDAALEAFINNIDPEQKFTVYLLPQWREARDYVASGVKSILERAAVRLKTIAHFGRLWPINFRVNAQPARHYGDISELKELRPDALVMAGPSLDNAIEELRRAKTIWCADTALPSLRKRQIFPRVVFSADAGFASREHFVGMPAQFYGGATLVCDILGFPSVQRLPFGGHLTYVSSHPLVQEFCASQRNDLTFIENPAGDVGSLMRAIYARLFGEAVVTVIGHDGAHRRRVTHARGTAYFSRTYMNRNRIMNTETYMLKLSRRYA